MRDTRPIPHSKQLQRDMGKLTPRGRKLRSGINEYMQSTTQSARYALAIKARRLAQFMRLDRNRWPNALDRLFSLRHVAAENTLERYQEWVRQQPYSKRTKNGLATFGFLKLSRALHSQGILKWSLRHKKRIIQDKKWSYCPIALRRDVDLWLREQQARNLADVTVYGMRNELQHFGFYLRRRGLQYPHLSYEDALRWMEDLNKSGLVPSGINRRLYLVQRFFLWLKARKVIEDSPFETFKSVKVTRKIPKILTEKEVVRVIRAAKPGRNRAVLEVLYASGCRVGGLCAIDLARVSFEDKTAITRSKGGHETVIYLNDSAIAAIRNYLPIREAQIKTSKLTIPPTALFLRRGAVRLSTYAGNNIVHTAGRKAGLSRPVHAHLIRHTFATHMLNRGADLYSIMQFLGHRSIQSTVRYLQMATAKLSEVHRMYHPRR